MGRARGLKRETDARGKSSACPVGRLISVGIAQDAGARTLAKAYRRIAAAIMEFIALREAHGSTGITLDRAAAALDAAIARGRCGFKTKALFNDLLERARLASGRAAARGANADLGQAGATHPRAARENRRSRLHRTRSARGGREGRGIARPVWIEPERTRPAQAKLRGDRRRYRTQTSRTDRRLRGPCRLVLRLQSVGGDGRKRFAALDSLVFRRMFRRRFICMT